MKTIVIKYFDGIKEDTIHFPDNRKGNSDSIKFIAELHRQRKGHPYFFALDKIKTIETKLKDYRLGRKTKKRFQLEVDLRYFQEERAKVLSSTNTPDQLPPAIKLSIVKQ